MTWEEDEPDRLAEAGDVYACAVELPVSSVRRARSAVALQLDRLSPLPVADVAFDVAALGPGRPGSTRFALGIIARAAFEPPDAPALLHRQVEFEGRRLAFRFRDPGRVQERTDSRRVVGGLVSILALCTGLVLLGFDRREARDVAAASSRLDDSAFTLDRLRALKNGRDAAAQAWASESALQAAALIPCAIQRLGGGRADPVYLTSFQVDRSGVSGRFSHPPPPARAGPPRGAGVTLAAMAGAGLAPGALPPGAASAPGQVFTIGARACR